MYEVLGDLVLQQGNGGGGIVGIIVLLIQLAFFVGTVAGGWKMLEKADEPGWGIIIPIYNIYLLAKIGGNPWWYVLLMVIPVVNLVISVKIFIDVAKSFGKGLGYGLAMWFLTPVFLILLGFGDAQYQGPP